MESQMVDVNALSRALMGLTHKEVSSTPTATLGHGPGGLFSSPALERQLFSAILLPRKGLQSRLPAFSNNLAYPQYGILTGVTATTGSEPEGPCDPFPVAGLVKLCTFSTGFGRMGRQTPVYEIDGIGRLNSRGEHTDFQVVGNAFADGNSANVPTMPGVSLSGAANTEKNKMYLEFATAWMRDFAKEIFTGNPANNTVRGGRKYFRGLDLLINTGYRDSENQVACPAADSIVRSFGNRNIETDGVTLVRQITNIHRNLRYIAEGVGLDPVKWVLVMRWSMFYELTEIWPCVYLTYRCNADDGQRFDAGRAIDMRDGMRGNIFNRTGQYLLIDGEQVEVVIDDGIAEYGIGGGTFRSGMYWVPLTVLGGTPVTYFDYINYDMPNGAMDFARAVAPDGFYMTSDSGRFLWHKPAPTHFCVSMEAKTEPRLVLRTPHLAARFDGIQYTPVQHEREPFTDSTYFVNGGNTNRNAFAPSYYSPTTNG